MAAFLNFLDKLFVGAAFGVVHKAYLWTLAVLWSLSGLLYGRSPSFAEPAKFQLHLDAISFCLLVAILGFNYARSRDSFRTLLWNGFNPVAWAFLWLSWSGFVDNYTRFPFIVVGVVGFVLQIVLVGAFVRSSLRRA